MTRTVYKFTFAPEVGMEEVDYAMAIAAVAVESIYGEPAMAMDGKFHVSNRQRVCLIDAETPVGQDLARVFAGFMNLSKNRGYRADFIEFNKPLGNMADHFRKFRE